MLFTKIKVSSIFLFVDVVVDYSHLYPLPSSKGNCIDGIGWMELHRNLPLSPPSFPLTFCKTEPNGTDRIDSMNQWAAKSDKVVCDPNSCLQSICGLMDFVVCSIESNHRIESNRI